MEMGSYDGWRLKLRGGKHGLTADGGGGGGGGERSRWGTVRSRKREKINETRTYVKHCLAARSDIRCRGERRGEAGEREDEAVPPRPNGRPRLSDFGREAGLGWTDRAVGRWTETDFLISRHSAHRPRRSPSDQSKQYTPRNRRSTALIRDERPPSVRSKHIHPHQSI